VIHFAPIAILNLQHRQFVDPYKQVPTMGLIQNPTIPDADCTLTTCSLLQAHLQYVPSLAANALFLSLFAVMLGAQIILGIKYQTWGFLGGMFGGLVLEILGYVGRVQMHYNPFTDNPFLMYIPAPNNRSILLTPKVPRLPYHWPSLPQCIRLSLFGSHHRCFRRTYFPLPTSNLHHHLHLLRFRLTASASSWWSYRFWCKYSKPGPNGYQHHDCWAVGSGGVTVHLHGPVHRVCLPRFKKSLRLGPRLCCH